jgi:hypothetical protein
VDDHDIDLLKLRDHQSDEHADLDLAPAGFFIKILDFLVFLYADLDLAPAGKGI